MTWMTSIFGGGSQKKAAAQARRENMVAQDRQLAELNRADLQSGLTRKRPRGRALYSDEALKNLPTTVA